MDETVGDVEEALMNAEAGPSSTTWPTAPTYDWTNRPTLDGQLQVAELESEVSANFFRSARWCPDGSSILTTAEDRILRVYDTSVLQAILACPRANIAAGLTTPSPSSEDPIQSKSTRSFSQPDAVNSTLWYPSASTLSPATFCFLASVRDNPVRLVDASDGRIRASYPIVDHRERFIAPHSLAFNPTATKLYCGFDGAIEVFDVSNPGYDTSDRLRTTLSRRENSGQKGIVSALAFSSDYSGTFAAGSYSGSVSIYSEDTGATPLQHLEGIKGGGIAQVMFHPLNPHHLFVASRRSSCIQVYDMRDTSDEIGLLVRESVSNQRLSFDIDPWGRYLAAGATDGCVKVWDIANPEFSEPIYEGKLHNDAVGSVQLHPFKPCLLSVAGSRSFLERGPEWEDDDSDTSSDESSESSIEEADNLGILDESSISGQDKETPKLSAPSLIPEWKRPKESTMSLWSFAPL